MSRWPSTKQSEFWQHCSGLAGKSKERAKVPIEFFPVTIGRILFSHFMIRMKSAPVCWRALPSTQDFDRVICDLQGDSA